MSARRQSRRSGSQGVEQQKNNITLASPAGCCGFASFRKSVARQLGPTLKLKACPATDTKSYCRRTRQRSEECAVLSMSTLCVLELCRVLRDVPFWQVDREIPGQWGCWGFWTLVMAARPLPHRSSSPPPGAGEAAVSCGLQLLKKGPLIESRPLGIVSVTTTPAQPPSWETTWGAAISQSAS